MGSNYVCEDGVPASTQCEDDPSSGTSGQTGAGAGAGASSNTGAAHSAAPRARSGSRPVKLLLSAALAAALNGYVIALPVALFGLLQPATAALTSSLVPLSQLPPTVSASPLLPAAPVGPQKLTIRTSCSNNGALSCGDGGNSFFLCSEGTLVDMGHVAAGTVCVDGGIVAAAGGAGAGAGAGAGIDSGAVGRSVGLGLLAGGLAISALGAPMAAVLDGICGD